MSPLFVLGRENVPCVAEAVSGSLKADCTDFTKIIQLKSVQSAFTHQRRPPKIVLSQHNYDPFFSKPHFDGMLSKTKLCLNLPKEKEQ